MHTVIALTEGWPGYAELFILLLIGGFFASVVGPLIYIAIRVSKKDVPSK